MPHVSSSELKEFAVALLVAGGVGNEEAALVAESLVGANLRGHDSHGVMRIPYYLDGVKKGDVRPGASLEILRETNSILMADGNWGFGQTQMTRLTEKLIAKTKENGVAVGTLVHSTHIGRLGEYCELAAGEELMSMIMVNTHGAARRVAPVGGTAPRLGTNPFAVGVPCLPGPLILDFGTSATAEGKVRVKKIAGELCPDGWLLDSEGRPTNDPNSLYANPPGTILPMGGDQAYKGFGLALIVEIFAGALSGGACACEVPKNQLGNCVFVQLFDPEYFGGTAHFEREVGALAAYLRSCPPIDSSCRIQLPGDPERRAWEQRTTSGIPLDEGNWSALRELADCLGVVSPAI